MVKTQIIGQRSPLTFSVATLLLLTIVSQSNARNIDWFRKSSFRSDPLDESGRWFRYTGNRNWFGRSAFHRDVQDLDSRIKRLERDAEANIRVREGLPIDNYMITENEYTGANRIEDEHPWRRRNNRRYI